MTYHRDAYRRSRAESDTVPLLSCKRRRRVDDALGCGIASFGLLGLCEIWKQCVAPNKLAMRRGCRGRLKEAGEDTDDSG